MMLGPSASVPASRRRGWGVFFLRIEVRPTGRFEPSGRTNDPDIRVAEVKRWTPVFRWRVRSS